MRPLVLRSDGCGEMRGDGAVALCAEFALYHDSSSPDSHNDGAERAHRHLYESVRPAMAATRAPKQLRGLCAAWAADARNTRAVAGMVSHIVLFGDEPDLTSVAPFYSWVAAYDNARGGGRFASRGITGWYLGLARAPDVDAIRVIIGDFISVVRACRWVAAPNAVVGPTVDARGDCRTGRRRARAGDYGHGRVPVRRLRQHRQARDRARTT